VTESLITLAEIAVLLNSNKSLEDVERIARDMGFNVVANSRSQPCLQAQMARDMTTGARRVVFRKASGEFEPLSKLEFA
jgi:hypothetical protein